MNGIKKNQRVFQGHEGHDFVTDYGDYGTDEDSYQQRVETTTTISNDEHTNPGHGRAKRESGEF